MTKLPSIFSVGGLRRLNILKPVAILVAILLLPPEMPFFGRFSVMPKAKAQISVCGNQATIFQTCATASNAFEVEALSDYETQYNLKPGDGNLIYALGRTDLRMSFRAFMFTKLITAIKASPANRTAAESAMISYFQGVVQQHEIAEYTAATADRDLFQQHLCQWVPDTDIEQAYGESIFLTPYCNFGGNNPLSGLLSGPPDLPTIDYFIAKGYKIGYEQPLEAAAGKTVSNSLPTTGVEAGFSLSQTQTSEIAALGSIAAVSPGAMIASRNITYVLKGIWPKMGARLALKARRLAKLNGLKVKPPNVNELELIARALRAFAAVSIALEIATTVISVVFAVLDAEQQQNEIDSLNVSLALAKGNLPDLGQFLDDTDGLGFEKLTSVFLELTLPEFSSVATLPLPAPTDPQFVTTTGSGIGQAGPITFQDQDSQTWTAQPYSQNWFVLTGTDANHNPITRFSNYLTYLGWDTSGNQVAYKAWINNGNFTVGKILPNTTDVICQAGSNGLYQGDTTNCASFTPDSLFMADANGNPMNITISQGVVYDSPNPANAAFAAGTGGSVTIKARGIPAPIFDVTDLTPDGLTYSNLTHTAGATSVQVNISKSMAPQSFTFHALFSNGASSISVPFTINIDTAVHITSPTTFNLTYGTPVNSVITATGTPVQFNIPTGPWPAGVTITDQGNGTATITGTPVASGKILSCLGIGVTGCVVTASNGVSSDTSPLVVNVATPVPFPTFTSPNQVTFRAGEYNEFVVKINGGLTPAGVNVYHAVDACPSSDPSWLVETQRPNGDLLLSGTPPFLLNNQTINLAFSAPLIGSLQDLFSCASFSFGLAMTVASFPIFPATQYLIVQPGAPVPANNFVMGSSFNSISETGVLPAGMNFNSDSAEFSFSGAVSVAAAPGDYPLQINSRIISNNNSAAEVFHVIVAQPPVDQGFKTFNLPINRPANILINPSGFPKNAVGTLPTMTATLTDAILLPAGLQQGPGPMEGSIQITGTPTQLATFGSVVTATNGVAPDLIEGIQLRVINPGDINADGRVDCADVSMVKAALNTKLGLAGYNNLADVNGDGIVNAQDLALVAKYLTPGTKCQ